MRVVAGIDEAAIWFRCFLDGFEVTLWCHAADDEEGWVDLYDVGEDGRIRSQELFRRFGHVELVREKSWSRPNGGKPR